MIFEVQRTSIRSPRSSLTNSKARRHQGLVAARGFADQLVQSELAVRKEQGRT